jgi:hypothetical protein
MILGKGEENIQRKRYYIRHNIQPFHFSTVNIKK